MDKSEQERLCFIRQGDNGMQVEIVGSPSTLMSMLQSALLSHTEVRRIMMPLFLTMMKDEKFLEVAMNDAMSFFKDDNEDEEEIIDTE
jgi:hypothetical protein